LEKLYKVRVKRKGQVTVPAHIREKMNIDEGAILEVKEHPEGILLKPLSGIKSGKPVGKKEYEKIIGELDKLRSEWR
jgi:AbrB family looped-hinge helix DNA binding protein